jgi:SAM-dependent methyltransferase
MGPGDSSFDLVLAATSWHWLDRERRYVRAAAILRPGGVLAIITTHHVLPADGDPFFSEIQEAYNALDAGAEADAAPGTPPPLPDQVGDEREDIEASALFGDVKVRRYLWEQSYTEDQYLSLLDTYSGHRSMTTEARQALGEAIRRRIRSRPNRSVRKHYLFTLHVARLR